MAPSLPDRPDAVFLQNATQDASIRLGFAEEPSFGMSHIVDVVARHGQRRVVEQERDPLADRERLPVTGVGRAGAAANIPATIAMSVESADSRAKTASQMGRSADPPVISVSHGSPC